MDEAIDKRLHKLSGDIHEAILEALDDFREKASDNTDIAEDNFALEVMDGILQIARHHHVEVFGAMIHGYEDLPEDVLRAAVKNEIDWFNEDLFEKAEQITKANGKRNFLDPNRKLREELVEIMTFKPDVEKLL